MELPLFPLHLVLFPGTNVPLHVFEPRYRAMLEHVLGSDRTFGIVAIRQGMEAGGTAEVHEIGTIARVDEVRRSSDGTMDIIATGGPRFRLSARLPDDPYPRGDVELLGEPVGPAVPDDITRARAAVHRYLGTVARLHGRDVHAPALPDDLLGASFALAAALQIDLPDRQRLLAAPDAAQRLELVVELARRESLLLQAIGPSVGRPDAAYSPN